jgi:uncharacterized membrane protein YhaH (DUF805 family)
MLSGIVFVLLNATIPMHSKAVENVLAGVLIFTLLLTQCVSVITLIKRWHDLNESGFWVLINLVPLAALITLIYAGCVKGTTGPNKYGDDPLQDMSLPQLSVEGHGPSS